MTESKIYDLVILGGGPGGYVAAIRAAQLGQATAIVEQDALGGICLNWGCIPTKALLKSAEVYRQLQHADRYGLQAAGISVDFPAVIQRSRDVAESLSNGVAYLMKKHKVDVISGRGKLLSADRLAVDTGSGLLELQAGHIILATGARPRPFPGAEFDGQRVLTARDAMSLEKMPARLLVIGAGAIGVEFADFYASLGSEVTILEMLPHLLPIEDEEVSRELERNFKKRRIGLQLGARVESLTTGGNEVNVQLLDKRERAQTLTADQVLVAIGVQGNVENIGLEEVGIDLEQSWIRTDDYMRTSVPGIYAIGDVAGPPWLAHVASHEGITAAEHLAGLNVHPMRYDNIPGCTYCSPQVASIGMTEAAAREAGHEVQIGKFPYRASGKALAAGEPDGFTKLIFDARYGELLGAHIIGAEATELIAEIGLARRLEATPEAILGTIHAHPTLSETIMEASGLALDRGIHF